MKIPSMLRFVGSPPAPFAAFLVAGLMLTAPGSPAAAQLQMPEYRGLRLSGDFQLVVSGEKVPDAEIYSGTTPPAFLIMSPKLPAPVLVVPGGARVETLNLMKLAKRSDGSIDILPQATLEPQGNFGIEGEAVVFAIGGADIRLERKPPLLGRQQASDLKAYSSLYSKGAEAYSPNAATLGRLRGESKPVRVQVFFGSWCPMCQRMVPKVVRLSDELRDSAVRFEFYGLPHGFQGEPEAEKYDVTAVPTAIVFVDGQEVGRIQGNGWLNPEQTLAGILWGGSPAGR